MTAAHEPLTKGFPRPREPFGSPVRTMARMPGMLKLNGVGGSLEPLDLARIGSIRPIAPQGRQETNDE